MLMCFEKKIEKNWRNFENFIDNFESFFNLEVLDNFNKMYTIMYSFHCFFKEKHCTLIVYITEFFLKSGGAKCITGPPPE